MLNLKNHFLRKLIVLAAALLLVLVGISCKKKPTEAGGMELERPDDKVDVIGGDGSLTDPTQIEKYRNEMINIRLISDSGDGEAYYRCPVVVTYGANGMGMALFYEKRFGQGGDNDVGVDGNAKVDIVYMANAAGGDNLHYSSDNKVGSDPSASEGAQYSKGSPVVFVSVNNIAVVAAAGGGASPQIAGRGESEIKIAKGTASGNDITFVGWEELNITYTNTVGQELKGSEAIRQYVEDKMRTKFGGSEKLALYTRWGQGKTDGNSKWVLPINVMKKANDGGNMAQGVLVIYSEDKGDTWKFGPNLVYPSSYRTSLGLSVSGNTVKLAAVPRVYNDFVSKPVGIYSGDLGEDSVLSLSGTSTFVDSENNYEVAKKTDGTGYFINTRKRENKYFNGFIMNQELTLASLDDADTLKSGKDMLMSQISGSGSVAVLSDGTIVTVAEEAFAEFSREGENRFNIVQRRFSKEYVESHDKINQNEEYYNKSLGQIPRE